MLTMNKSFNKYELFSQCELTAWLKEFRDVVYEKRTVAYYLKLDEKYE